MIFHLTGSRSACAGLYTFKTALVVPVVAALHHVGSPTEAARPGESR